MVQKKLQPMTGKLSPSIMGNFLNQGRIRQHNEQDGFCCSYAVQKIQQATCPNCSIRPPGYGITFPFNLR